MIFSAGLGKRMRPLTDDLPKPLVRVGGQPMIDRAISHGNEMNCAPVVANVHYRADQMSDYLAERGIAVSDETDALLETGGGLKKALPRLGRSDLFTLNPDVLWLGPNPLGVLEDHWRGTGTLLLLVHPDRAHARVGQGDFSLEEGRLVRGGALIYGGAQIIDANRVAAFPKTTFSLNEVWDVLAEEGELHGVVYPGEWCDLGTPDAVKTAEALLAAS